MKFQPPDSKYQIVGITLPKAVLDLAEDSNRLVIKPKCLFFRESKPTFSVPGLQPWDVFGSMQLSHKLYYLYQKNGSLAVYAYLYGGKSNSKASYGCLYVGSIGKGDWTFGGKNDCD
jgi:hypothetical protein